MPYRTPAEMPAEPRRRWGVTRWRRILFKLRYGWELPEVRRMKRSLARIVAENERMAEELERMKFDLDADVTRVTNASEKLAAHLQSGGSNG
jgi:regulator of replication initiation timing